MNIMPVANHAIGLLRFKQNFKTQNQPKINFTGVDTFNYSANKPVTESINVDFETAKAVAKSLATSTAGHRATYGGETFNEDVVKLITLGALDYAKEVAGKEDRKATVLIGGDTRIATKKSLPVIKEVLLNHDVNVINIEKPVPSPLLALAAEKHDVDLAILMTASHNPWEDGGYNFVTREAAIAPSTITKKIADNIVRRAKIGQFTYFPKNNAYERTIFPYDMYKQQINSYGIIDWKKIKDSNIEIFYDSLNGTGSNVMPHLLKDYNIGFNEINSGKKEGPNPTEKNLKKLSKVVANADKKLRIGIANDGDADRFGVIDEKGRFIHPNDVILLTAYHLAKNKGLEGTLVHSQATTKQVDELADMYNLDTKTTPVGFKYIAEDILDLRKEGKDILVAGEESGGLTISKHIPEKDGIIATLLMLDLIATEQKPISKILKQVKKDLPNAYEYTAFSKKLFDNKDKELIMSRVQGIYEKALAGKSKFGNKHHIDVEETIRQRKVMEQYKEGGDGIKLFLTDGSTILVRKSGTEPLVRCYIEASGKNQDKAEDNAEELKEIMEQIFTL